MCGCFCLGTPGLQNNTWPTKTFRDPYGYTLCYAIVLQGKKSGFGAGFRPEPSRGENRNRPSGRPKAGLRTDVDVFPVRIRPKTGPEARCSAIVDVSFVGLDEEWPRNGLIIGSRG